MRSHGYAVLSLGLFAAAVLSLAVTSTLLDAALGGLPFAAQRAIFAITLVLPAVVGGLVGALGFVRDPRRKLLAAVATVLNVLFALFFGGVLVLSG